MKRRIAFLMSAVLLVSSLTGCGGNAGGSAGSTSAAQQNSEAKETSEEGQTKGSLSGKTLRVGTMPVTIGVPVQYAYDKGYFDEAGLDVEIVLFATGAPVNEAMAAGEIDVAVSGMASVYALATGLYTYIGDGSITLDGEAIYARSNSDIVKEEGVIPGTKGSAETVRGKSILGPLATTAHFMAIKYAESFGLTSDDFTMMSMEYAQAYQAFIMGDGDLLATKPPYTSQLENEGYVRVCGISEAMGSPMVNAIYTQNSIFEDRQEDLKLFLDCYYRACEELNQDKDLRKDYSMKWYEENGITFSEGDMEDEIETKIYHTLKTLDTEEYPFGFTMMSIGEFFMEQGMIDKENLPNIKACMNDSVIKELKAESGK
ncbi:ABC transporter substrate-binding protein [Lacrimispora indolis]|uniref:ABC transporter substrate-binding protein n=1 Tax=Lacrimispora indolis TaxID=69825 RepID=UPI000429E609|nr:MULTISPECIES: NrtA/SsuA/CpmA family ABC transporter substrate-binding protein [Lachnospiraceae]MBE7722698.1 ABC transporter substrate-binding protein [Lacrimispora celerecrescens]